MGSADVLSSSRMEGAGPTGALPLTPDMLLDQPSGDLFGLTQNVGMGWSPGRLAGAQYLILSTLGGLRGETGEPLALGYHTGHWEIGLLVRRAAEELRTAGAIPFAGYCSDPCDGRTQGTTGMFDSLPYRNDAAVVMRRLIRSLPTASGVLGVATCDKGLPAMMMALAGSGRLPGVIVPGGVTLPAAGAEDAGRVQSLGARFARDMISLDYAREMGCRACGSSGGGCQFLGTAATSQVVAEALGMALPHSALAPSGEPVWLELGSRSAIALRRLHALGMTTSAIVTDRAIENAMLVHAAFGGSTNLLLHIPAIAHAAGLRQPSVDDWVRVNRATRRLVAAQRATWTSDRAGVHGRRRSGGHAAPPRDGAARHRGHDRNGRYTRCDARLVGIERTARSRAAATRRRGSDRSGRRHPLTGRREEGGPGWNARLPGRQHRAGRLGHKGDGDRSGHDGCGRHVPSPRSRTRLHGRT
jgi:putative YjhG/YagF family dehydratase